LLKYSYYPFENELENIDSTDLLLLRNVSEGWYIDYKSQGLKISDFAKHLSAFANQYGGWLILGVCESQDGSRTAETFKGIASNELDKITRDIREASAAHISPEVLYEEKVINGPIDHIGLEAGFSILVVGVPMSHNTPHIHSSGRIYRRLADQSKPKEETDRFILDELWKRGKSHKDEVTRFLTTLPELPPNQQSSPWIHIYLKPAEGQTAPSKKLSFDDFSKIIKNLNHEVKGMHAPMQAIYTTVGGYIARQIKNNDPNLALLTFRWWNDGRVRFDIPLNECDIEDLSSNNPNYKHAKRYCDIAHSLGYKQTKVVDYTNLIFAVGCLTNTYIHLLKHLDDNRDTYSCFNIRNVFHTSPYIDAQSFIRSVENNSLPLTHENSISFPQIPSESNMIRHDRDKRRQSEKDILRPILFSFPTIYIILEFVGAVSNVKELLEDRDIWRTEI
jgi:hypothetical protein